MITKRILRSCILLGSALLSVSCTKRYVCPDYFSAYHFGEKVNEQFFSYFSPPLSDSIVYGKAQEQLSDTKKKNEHGMLMFANDTIPKETPLMRGPQANQYGLIQKKVPLMDRIITSRQQNFNKVVLARVTIHKPDSNETVVFDPTLKEEEYVTDSSIVGDAPPVPVLPTLDEVTPVASSEPAATDSVAAPATITKDSTTAKKMIPDSIFFKGANWDQIVYNYTIGRKIMAHVDSMRPKWEAERKAKETNKGMACEKKLTTLFGLLCKKPVQYDSLGTPIEKRGLFARIFGKKKGISEIDTVSNEHENEEWYAKTEDDEQQKPNEFDAILQQVDEVDGSDLGKEKKTKKSKKPKKEKIPKIPKQSEAPKSEDAQAIDSEQ